MRTLATLSLLLVAGCGDDAGSLPDAPGLDGAPTEDGTTSDAPTDSAVSPLIEELGDGTVTLEHTMPGCPPSYGFDATGAAYIVHSAETSANLRVKVAKLVNNRWTDLGEVVDDPTQTLNVNICPPLVVTSAGVPFVAYVSENSTTRRVRVRKLVANTWQDAYVDDRPIAQFAPAIDLDMTIDAMERPVLATAEFVGTNYKLRVRRLEGASFVAVGAPSDASIASVRVTTRPDTSIAALVSIPNGFSKSLSVALWDGQAWTDSPQVNSVPDSSTALVPVDIDADGTSLWVSYWMSATAPAQVLHTAKLSTSSWVELGSATDGGLHPTTQLTTAGAFVQTFSALSTARIDAWRFDGTTFGAITQLPLTGADYARVGAHGNQTFVGWRRPNAVHLAKLTLP